MSCPYQIEQCRKADVISQARVLYGPKYPAGSVFDVVWSVGVINRRSCVSHLVVYPTTKLSGKCIEILRSAEFQLLCSTYSNLSEFMVPKIRGCLDDQNKQDSNDVKILQ